MPSGHPGNYTSLTDATPEEAEAAALISHQITTIAAHWHATCDEADLSPVDRKLFAGRQFLNEYALENLTGQKALHDVYKAVRETLRHAGQRTADRC